MTKSPIRYTGGFQAGKVVDLSGPAPTVMAHGVGGVADTQLRIDAPAPSDHQLPNPQVTGDKPPYRVPSMREIEAVPWNGLTVASTFSGCGGSCLGFRMAGYRVAWSSEFVAAARETYRANHPSAVLDDRDIRQVKPEEILAVLGLQKGQLDVFEGSPPCASFSMAGKREKLWGQEKAYSDRKQRTDDLFTEYLRILSGLMPRAFVAENVAGMVVGTAKGHFLEALSAMRALGYRVGAKILDAQWLGVPQARRRVIFVGVREDLGVDPPFPKPLPYRYSIRDALPWLGSVTSPGTHGPNSGKGRPLDGGGVAPTVPTSPSGGSFYRHQVQDAPTLTSKGHGWFDGGSVNLDRPAPTLPATEDGAAYYAHELRAPAPPTPEELAEVNFERFAIGREWEKLAPGEGSDKYLNLSRSHPDLPSPTVTATAGHVAAAGVAHPLEPRKFTISELRRLCGFPDDFVLTGTYAQQWERLGRAVPPPMMAAVARELAVVLLAAGGR